MNALIASAVLGVIMMFSSFLLKPGRTVRNLAVGAILVLLVLNILEMNGILLFRVDTKGMIVMYNFSVLFSSIAIGSTLVYLLLSGKEMEKVGLYVSEYFALIFFIICEINLTAAFK